MLNVPAAQRIAQITANMERWRWMPRQLERRYVAVNVPDQSLAFIRDGRAVLTSRVIVGRRQTPTPILRTSIETIVANPPWNIPGDIAARTLLPELRKNPNYLRTRNMVVVNAPDNDPQGRQIDWRSVRAEAFPYQIQQSPGPNSALGVLMLDSPNDFDVYLHDTPGKNAFRQTAREISNGCVRVEQILALASLALTDNENEGSEILDTAIASRETERLSLAEPLPVYMLYWTAVVDADGTVGFRPDRYGRDRPLIAALAE
jgi:murein L,D-transpeptidase YcbB/YkuD